MKTNIGRPSHQNKSNYEAHFNGTGPRFGDRPTHGWMHSYQGQVRLLCYAALLIFNYSCHGIGTGGTIAGTGQFMKMMNPNVMIVLADPEGSGLYNKVRSVRRKHLLMIYPCNSDQVRSNV